MLQTHHIFGFELTHFAPIKLFLSFGMLTENFGSGSIFGALVYNNIQYTDSGLVVAVENE